MALANKRFLIITILILAAGIGFLAWERSINQQPAIKITVNNTEKGLPDKPEGNNAAISFKNSRIEEAVIKYLLTQDNFSWKTRSGSLNFCSIENLQPENELFPFYIWVYCGEYIKEDRQLELLSGTSLPVKINYPNELSFYDINKFSYEAPGDGSRNGDDIKRIFPEDAQRKISNLDKQGIIDKNEAIALSGINAWESAKQAIKDCQAQRISQLHSKDIAVRLKDGNEIAAIEPEIDDIIDLAKESESRCGQVLIATE